jgi:hypothetical protein
MCNILEETNLIKEKRPRKRIPENSVCCVCGAQMQEFKLRRFNDYIVCEKHYNQLEKYGKITDPTIRKHKKDLEICCICGNRKHGSIEGKSYCQKHFIQMQRYGEISERTIYDKNQYIIKDDYAIIVMFDKSGNKAGETKVDLDKVDTLSKYKIYLKMHGNKAYATINNNGVKIRLNRFLLGYDTPEKWDGKIIIDHINGDSLDNRLSNLREATTQQNMFNIKKKDNFVGVNFNKQSNKWVARITYNYQGKQLGTFSTKAEAILARLKSEKELFKGFGTNKDLYYVIDLPSPIDEINKILSEGA